MGYDKETSREYNKKYYQDKKHEKGLKKVICEFCGICCNALKCHYKSAKCQLAQYKLQNQII
jgi:hypothetical protein